MKTMKSEYVRSVIQQWIDKQNTLKNLCNKLTNSVTETQQSYRHHSYKKCIDEYILDTP